MADHAQSREKEFDCCIEQFESSWRSGNPRTIDEQLSQIQYQSLSETARHELLQELVMIDLEYRWRHSTHTSAPVSRATAIPQQPLLEDYLKRFPELGPVEKLLNEVIASEYRVRHRWGDQPSHSEYFERFPNRDHTLGVWLQRVDDRLPASASHRGLRIRCPHCQDSIELGDEDPGGTISCSSCKRRFSLVDESLTERQLAPGSRVGAFELIELVGCGSFGTVWKARDTELERYVAIKLPHQRLFDETQHEQFLREARAAAQLNHANIVPVYEVGRDSDRLFIVTQLVIGSNLSDRLTAHRFAPRDAAYLCSRIADALDHAHQHGVIHRDLKPSNIMLDDRWEPRLMDFGLAKRAAGEVTVTIEGKLLGTPAYMSPEQARGSAHAADRRSDVYSLGVILFELLTGERPFGGSTEMLLERILSEDAVSPRRLSSSIPKDLETICLKCLEKDPGHRYSTAAQLRDDLSRFLQGAPVFARPITKADRAWRWCKRNRTVATLAATAASLLLILAVAGPLVALSQAKAREQTRWQLYLSDMDVALQAWEAADVRRVLELLERHMPQGNQNDQRGFEWYHLWRLCQRSVNAPTLDHALPVSLLSFSDDGSTLASASAQVGYRYEIKLWDPDSAKERINLRFDRQGIWAAAFSPDAKVIALGYNDGKVKLWDIATGKLTKTFAGHRERILALAFSHDGSMLASRSRKMVAMWGLTTQSTPTWTIATAEPATTTPPIWVNPMAFSPESNILAWGTTDGIVNLCDARTGDELGSLSQHKGTINSVAFSHDGAMLASGSIDRTITVWDVESRQPRHRLVGHKGFVFCVAFAVDGKTLASGSLDNTVKFWDMRTGKEIETLKGHASWVTSVVFAPNGDTLASGSEDHTVKLWSIDRENEQDVLEGHEDFIWSVAFSPEGEQLASGSWDTTVRLWDLTTGKLDKILRDDTEWIWSVAYSPNGKTLATGSGILGTPDSRGRVRLWNVIAGEMISASKREMATVRSVAFSPRGDTLAVGLEDGKVLLLECESLALYKPLGSHADTVHSVAFSPDGKSLASSGRDNLVKIWDVESGHHRNLNANVGWVFCVAFSPNGKLLASGHRDNTVRIWDVKTGRERATLKGHAGWVMCVTFAPDGNTVVSGDANSMVKLWDATTGELRANLGGHGSGVHCVAFSPNGDMIASGDNVHQLRLWRAATTQEVRDASSRDRYLPSDSLRAR